MGVLVNSSTRGRARDRRLMRQSGCSRYLPGSDCSLAVLLAAGVLISSQAFAQAVPRVPVGALPKTPKVEYGGAILYQTSGNTATLKQTTESNIVSWKSFDIGRDATVNVQQLSAASVLLNKVEGGAYLNKTTIDGMLNARGRVYIYNPNGIVFGKTGQVNVNTLVGSSLKFDESRVIAGLLQPGSLPVLGADPNFNGGQPGNIDVEAGARLTATSGGLLLLAAPNVTNNGQLRAVDGQVIMAAGNKIYLASPRVTETGTSLRGVLVEVSDDYLPPASGAPATPAPTAENGETGSINVGQGNATMIAYAVNQKGIVSATTSINSNGSIYLYARDQAVRPDANASARASRTGNLVLGANSVTRISPTLADDATITTPSAFNKSDIKLNGLSIELQGDGQTGAKVIAPGANVSIVAGRPIFEGGQVLDEIDTRKENIRVDFAKGSVIDVSGSTGTTLAMEDNVLNIDLRGTELADNLVFKNSPLYGSKVNIDLRKALPAGTAADVSGWLNQVKYKLGQLNTTGGSVSVSADGAIIQRTGSKIKVDGGWVDYKSGYVNTTQFVQTDGTLIDISAATNNTPYSSIFNPENSAKNFEDGYRQGGSAGSVRFSAPIVVMQGDLSGHATAGRRQRDPGAKGYPLGGQLQIGSALRSLLQVGGSATATATAPGVGQSFDKNNAAYNLLASRLDIDLANLSSDGFTRYSLSTSGDLRVIAPVNLPAGGQLALSAVQNFTPDFENKVNPGGGLSINAPIRISGGSFSASSDSLTVANGTTFDLAGRWVNDDWQTLPPVDALGYPSEPTAINGGKFSLSANQLIVGSHVSVDVSAGAWQSAQRKVTQGSAGRIDMTSVPLGNSPGANDSITPESATLQLGSDLALAGYGFGNGGTLRLVGRNVRIGNFASSGGADLLLNPAFFRQGGFTSYDIAANVNFDILSNTHVSPLAASWVLNPASASTASGSMASVASPVVLDLAGPSRTRTASNVNFSALSQSITASAGRLTVGSDASVTLDPGASLALHAGRQMTVLGTLNASAGRILFDMTGAAFSPERSIWFGPKAQILATGSLARLYTNGDGISSGDILDGGSIQVGSVQNGTLQALFGYVVAKAGSKFDVSGISTSADGVQFRSFGGLTAKQKVASSAGSIDIRARTGLLLAGNFVGAADAGANGGSLTIGLDRENSNTQYPDDDRQRVLTILPGTASAVAGIVPSKLNPNEAVVFNRIQGEGANAKDLGWFLAGSPSGDNAEKPGQGWISTRSFADGGFGRLNFKSQDVLAFGLGKSSQTLSARDSLVLDAPILRAYNNAQNSAYDPLATVAYGLTLLAPHIQIGSVDQRYQGGGVASSGKAAITASATNIDLIGNSAWQGFGRGKFDADESIRLVGISELREDFSSTGYAKGSLAIVGNLSLTDTQTFPVTLSDYTFNVAGDGVNASSGRLSFFSNGNAPGEVLSAAGSLTANAKHIVQAGRVLAPFGSINMGNTSSSLPIITSDIDYQSGSVTSVAGAGVVPFGSVQNGSVPIASQWQYVLSDGTLVTIKQDPVAGSGSPERALPAKAIRSSAATVKAESGSLQDISGGGSLFAYDFTPGKGGSKDVLANNTPGSKTTVFAINPAYHGSVAPIDATYGHDGGLQQGDSVYLSEMRDADGNLLLAAGRYTLLPAHYALLPGGFSISVAANTKGMQASNNKVLIDGTLLVAGQASETSRSSSSLLGSGFFVSPRSLVGQKSQFTFFDADSYFTNKAVAAGLAPPERPQDGGYISFNVTDAAATALAWQSTIALRGAAGGRGGVMDVSAPQIKVVSNQDQATGQAVKLLASDLSALGADSLLLGALRNIAADGSEQLTVSANSVSISNDAQHVLSGHEIMLAAKGNIGIEGASVVEGTGGKPGRKANGVSIDGSGAFLRVSGGVQVEELRSNPATASGKLSIAKDARVAATGSAILDATSSLDLAGLINVAAGGALALGAPGFSMGDGLAAALNNKVKLDAAYLARLGALSELAFNSYSSTIDLYGSVSLGSDTKPMRSLSFRGAGMQGYAKAANGSPRNASFTAKTVRFAGPVADVATSSLAAPAGGLTVSADTVEIGSNAFAIHGFANVDVTARSEVKATGRKGKFSTDGDLSLSAGRIITAAGADASFDAQGTMTLAQVDPGNPPAFKSAPGKGGQLSFTAGDIVSDAVITAASGKVTMAADTITLNSGTISTAGASVKFGSTIAYAPGGSIELSAGDVSIASDATLDVSAVGAAAGTLAIAATRDDGSGTVQLDGTLKGAAKAGIGGVLPEQGRFSLDTDDAGSSAAFGALNASLDDAGFKSSRLYRFRTGDVALAGNDRITAHQVRIAADNGNVTIGGNAVIDASGAKGGSIELYAAQASAAGNAGRVTLKDNAQLLAKGTQTATSEAGSAGNGGRVIIGTGNADGTAALSVNGGGSIALQGGSIDSAGSSSARNGTVTLRAPRVGAGAGSDVAIASINADIRNSSTTVVEAYKVYQADTVSELADDDGVNLDATSKGQMYTDAVSFSANAAAILSRLKLGANSTTAASLALRSGIEVQSSDTLTVSVNEFAASAADRGWNLDAWRFGGSPVTLTLRAGGGLNIIGSISDGFVKPGNGALSMPNWLLDSGASASYRLVAGADFAAANLLAVNHGEGDVMFGFAERTPDSAAPVTRTDAPVAMVRTGTGSIDIAAGQDVILDMAKFFTVSSDNVAVDGTPAIFDVANSDGTYKVTLYGASVYTAGQAAVLPDSALFNAPKNALNVHYGAADNTLTVARFGKDGGAITVAAGRDVRGPEYADGNPSYLIRGEDAVDPDPSIDEPGSPAIPSGPAVLLSRTVPQLVNDWLFRQGRSYVDANGSTVFETLGDGSRLNTAWWSRTDHFSQGMATFGGGDLTVTSGANIANLSTSVATNAYSTGATPGTMKEQGGGDLLVRAGGDILGGSFYVQKGEASLRADGSVTAGSFVPQPNDSTIALNPVLALGDARVSVIAGRDLAIETSYNPMLTEQSIVNTLTRPYSDNALDSYSRIGPVFGRGAGGLRWDVTDVTGDSLDYRQRYAQFSNYSTYGSDSAVALSSIGGNVLLSNDIRNIEVAGSNDVPDLLRTLNTGTALPTLYTLAPGQFRAAALSGNLTTLNAFTMMPSAQGQLDLLAAGSISLTNGQLGAVRMLDNDPASMSTSAAPRIFTSVDLNVLAGSAGGVTSHQLGGLHANDATPVHVIAAAGDIVGDSQGQTTLSLPKYAEIRAGRDIRDLGFTIQQNLATDASVVVAGRDFIDTTQANGPNGADPSVVTNIVTGPGRIDISAGRNVDFGNGSGLVTRGNLDNPYLKEGGASINIVAGGAQADYARLVKLLGLQTVFPSAGNLSDLRALLAQNKIDIADNASVTDVLLAFGKLPKTIQDTFANSNPDFPLSLKDIQDLRSFTATEMNTLLSGTSSVSSVVAAWKLLPAAQKQSFLNNNPDAATDNGAAGGSGVKVLNVDAVTNDANLLAGLADFVNTQMAQLLPKASPEQLWAAFGVLPNSDLFFTQAGKKQHVAIENRLSPLTAALAAGDKSRLNGYYFEALDRESSALGSFDNLIAALFPTATRSSGGDIAVFSSQIKTVQGGNIDLLVPGGSVFAGLTTGTNGKKASEQGIFTLKGGAIRSQVKQEFLVNQGRAFALGGGDVYLVSQQGDIDAGKGAKTASSAPPPIITIDANGSVSVDASASIAGSGIATFVTGPNQHAGDVFLIAPRGVVDAGDAGVRSGGSIKVNATVVLNADNFASANGTSGVAPAVSAPALGGVSAPSSATSQTDSAAKSLGENKLADANKTLSVEVLGYGGDDDASAPDSSAGKSAGESDDDAEKKKKKSKKPTQPERIL